jgi:DNA-binding response OmpR family regulator
VPKILVIDDDPLIRSLIARVLCDEGYESLVAVNGRQGLKIFDTERPDLIITDIIMPDMEGIETIRELRAINPDVRIIAISGGGRIGNVDYLSMAAKFGAREVICKPFELSELTASVERCLAPRAEYGTQRPGSAAAAVGAGD